MTYRTEQPRTIRLAEYSPPAWLVDEVALDIVLHPDRTRVTARLSMRRNPAAAGGADDIVLDGRGLPLLALKVDGRALSPGEITKTDETLTVPGGLVAGRDRVSVETETEIAPAANTALEGLYLSKTCYCTQCEAHGFRKITFYPDRPDVLAVFRTRITGDPAKTPVMLSNGNKVGEGTLPDGRAWVEWHDPFPKPAYLFALVAGDLALVEDSFTTMSGREVALQIYVEHGNEDRTAYAMDALKRSMRWDEEAYGREYDLDLFMIVAVSDFNMGAMENKGLNIFNAKYILAKPDTATDLDYALIEGIIAHEYFHNWTGNRVTCRDWFQLCLKEGLTVFRDQQFSADMRSAPVKRIEDVRALRARQFPEDAGPLAHPVRPEAYIEINNFYTATVYEKGSELCRMLHLLLGAEGFRKGTDLYFDRHDGEAATVEDFIAAMAEANGRDLSQFARWYSQAGTPVVSAAGTYDADARTYTLDVRQTTRPTPGQPAKSPMHMPMRMGLVGEDGTPLPLRLQGEEQGDTPTDRVLELTGESHRFVFEGVDRRPIPSLFRGFSAPVRLETGLGEAEDLKLLAADPDPFNRWEAGQRHGRRRLLALMGEALVQKPFSGDPDFCEGLGAVLADEALDPAFKALALQMPTAHAIVQEVTDADPDAIFAARQALQAEIASHLKAPLLAAYERLSGAGDYSPDAADAGRRSLRNVALHYLSLLDDPDCRDLAADQFRAADNMTDTMAALATLTNMETPAREEALAAFYDRFKDDELVLDKWFSVQATSWRPDALQQVQTLTGHPAFTMRVPNRVYALIGGFASGNPVRFHGSDGAGYRFLADRVLMLDKTNPMVAARLLPALSAWKRYEPGRRALMKAELERIAATEPLSKDVYEIAQRLLAA
ncbi:aminopeptidase N [Futiania mangrovi]|uniref:Aminopeptidase N n=1 Tax=Futiania mangrovi TaxID=2959716 RepID=A0A9J6P8C1_9PROT|nr:aminopeptidase N [Futiania mangrovii]MCP1335876.1 aminopeptidase N [Futiania mangrovii]